MIRVWPLVLVAAIMWGWLVVILFQSAGCSTVTPC